MVAGGHVWLPGVCMAAGGHAWLPRDEGGRVVKGRRAWQRGHAW